MHKVLVVLLGMMAVHTLPAQMDVQGHRGARGLMPENTVEAMILAVDLGVRTLELDVVISADEQVVVSHEPWFSHVFSTAPDAAVVREEEERFHNIFMLEYEEIRKYDVGKRGNEAFPRQQIKEAYKPLLSELIMKVEAYVESMELEPMHYNIEIKSDPRGDVLFHPAPEKFSQLVLAVLDETLPKERFNIQSFDVRTLRWLHENRPDVALAYLFERMDEEETLESKVEALGFVPAIISPYYKLVDKKFMKSAKGLKTRVIPWTVNDEEEMKKLEKLGVHGIITDYPDMAVGLFGAYNTVMPAAAEED